MNRPKQFSVHLSLCILILLQGFDTAQSNCNNADMCQANLYQSFMDLQMLLSEDTSIELNEDGCRDATSVTEDDFVTCLSNEGCSQEEITTYMPMSDELVANFVFICGVSCKPRLSLYFIYDSYPDIKLKTKDVNSSYCRPEAIAQALTCMNNILYTGENEFATDICNHQDNTTRLVEKCFLDVGASAYCSETFWTTFSDQQLRDNLNSITQYCDKCGQAQLVLCMQRGETLIQYMNEGKLSQYLEECTDLVQCSNLENSCEAIPQPYMEVLLYFNFLEGLCDNGGCDGLDEKLQMVNMCIEDMTMNINDLNDPSINDICRHVRDAVNCLKDFDDTQCVIFNEFLLSKLSTITNFANFFGCAFDNRDSNNPDRIANCNVTEVIVCTNPVINGLHQTVRELYEIEPFTSDSSIQTFVTKLQQALAQLPDSPFASFSLKPFVCSYGILNIDWDAFYTCIFDAIGSCSSLYPFVGYDEGSNSAAERQVFGVEMQAIDDIYALFYSGIWLGVRLESFCDTDCISGFERSVRESNTWQTAQDYFNGNLDLQFNAASKVLDNAQEYFSKGCKYQENLLMATHEEGLLEPIEMQYIAVCGGSNLLPQALNPFCRYHPESVTNNALPTCVYEEEYKHAFQGDISDVCRVMWSELFCFLRYVPCCDLRVPIIQPRLHRYAMMNQLLDCNNYLGSDEDGHIITLNPTDSSCDYNDLLECYTHFLSSMSTSDNFIKMGELQRIVALKTPDEQICNVTEATLDNIASCRSEFFGKCSIPKLCAFAESDDDQEEIDVIDFEQLRQVISLCTEECENAVQPDNNRLSYSLHKVSGQVLWRNLIGESHAEACQEMFDIESRLKEKIGACSAYNHQIRGFLETNIDHSIFTPARQLCGKAIFNEFLDFQVSDTSTGGTEQTESSNPNKGPTLVFSPWLVLLCYVFALF